VTLPLAVEEITAPWLSAALTSALRREVRVDNLELTGVVAGTATKALIRVEYSAGGDGLPDRFCVKGGFVPELRAIMAPGYAAEACFYRDIAPMLTGGLPRCWFADLDAGSGQGIVVLDDLVARGVQFCDARHPLGVDRTAAGLELLAGWHARSDIAPSWLPTTPYFRPMVAGLLTPEHWNSHIDTVDSDAVRAVLTSSERIARAFVALWADEDERPATLIHGDANPTNGCLDGDAPRFVDWQFVCRGDAAHDVALFLIGALDPAERREQERPLLRTYLAARGADAEPVAEFWTAYRRHAIHGAAYALTPDVMQPREVRAALADRFAQAMLDLDSLDLLES
jgi:hypothetical protein